jgi:hypothetical protein
MGPNIAKFNLAIVVGNNRVCGLNNPEKPIIRL